MSDQQVAVMTWRESLAIVYQVLSYPLFELDGHGVSLGKLISGVILLIVSYLISRWSAFAVDRRIYTKLSDDGALRDTFRRLTFYFFMCLSTLFTLHALAVPVTIFTVLGGALAVGVGFGSQNLINNFISGVLVMVERPIRVGDYVDVDSITGRIENIGIRSTTVRTMANVIIVIPNTTFIEKNLTNWTMSNVINQAVGIGVAYDTDTDLLRRVCAEATSSVELVLSDPAPDIMFQDFGDSALVFDVTYFIAAESIASRRRIASAIRFRLNELFKKHKIEVPFPQRQVRMLT